MAFSGDTFTRLFSWVVNAGNGIKIRSDYMDQDTNDIANGLTTVAGRITALSTASLKQDGGGNVGIGGTAAGWVGTIGLQAPGDVALAAPFNTHLVSNAYSVSGTWKYLTTGGASRVTTAQGVTTVYSATSGTAGNNISWAIGLTQDINGNIGAGTTPSAWGNSGNLQLAGANIVGNGGLTLGSNVYYNGGWKYIGTGSGARYDQVAGQYHAWFVAPSGSAGGAVSFTQAMTLDNNGNLGLGTVPNPWSTMKALEGTTGALAFSSNSTFLMQNLYFNGANWIYKAAGLGAIYGQNGGGHQFYTAASGGAGGSASLVTVVSIQANGATAFSGAAATVPNRLGNTSGAVTLDCTKSNVFTMTLTGNMTSLSITNITDGQTINVIVTQDGTGSRTWTGLTSANGFLWAGGAVGVLSTPGGSRDILCLTYDSVAGKFFCTLAKAFA